MQKNIDTRGKVKRYLEVLSKYRDVEKCMGCECLQGALIQLKRDRPEWGKEIDSLLLPTHEMHKCLGCDPCPPADIWATYLKEKGE